MRKDSIHTTIFIALCYILYFLAVTSKFCELVSTSTSRYYYLIIIK